MVFQRSQKLWLSCVLLLVFMQYSSVVHGVEHHLFDEPLVAANSQCDVVHLQQHFDDAVSGVAGYGCLLAGRAVSAIDQVSAPLSFQIIGNHVRGPPLISLN